MTLLHTEAVNITLDAFLHEVILHPLLDFIKLLPFLFLTYLLMEFLEHKAGEKMERAVTRAGKVGPLFGGLLGLLPQCGFSAAASGLYAGRVITLGTLIAVFLATSDEMIPIMLAEQASPLLILKMLGIKLVIGVAVGFLVDAVYRRRHTHKHEHHHEEDEHSHGELHAMCESEGCSCGSRSIWLSALIHTLKVGGFLLAVIVALQAAVFFIGEDSLRLLFTRLPVVGPLVAALIGLVPNCASSILITNLFLEGMISAGSLLAGLLTGAGFGLVILFRTNKNRREDLGILILLYAVGAVLGILADLLNLGAIL